MLCQLSPACTDVPRTPAGQASKVKSGDDPQQRNMNTTLHTTISSGAARIAKQTV
jgi:hypothetical protein